MSEVMQIISSNQTLLTIFGFSFMIVITSIVLIFTVAFFQNREISFYPPKIGKKSEKLNNTKDMGMADDRIDESVASADILSGTWELLSVGQPSAKNGEPVYLGYSEIKQSAASVTAKHTQIKDANGREIDNKWNCHGYFLNSQLILFVKEERTPDLWVGANVLHFERNPKKYGGHFCLDGLSVYYDTNEKEVVAKHLLLKKKI